MAKETDPTLDDRLQEVNQQFEIVSLRAKYGKLYIRGSGKRFPLKPGAKENPKQIELPTGCNATPAGLKVARIKAHEVDSQLIYEKFDWTPYLRGKDKPLNLVGEWLKRYESLHWERTERTPTKEQTFLDCYRRYFMRIPADKPLTLDLLRETIVTQTNSGSRGRELACMAFSSLAQFAAKRGAIELDALDVFKAELRELKKGYKPEKILPEDLPTEEQILEIWQSIKNPAWRWVYGVIATYGLRPSEIFNLDLERFTLKTEALRVFDETKTGARLTYPCLPGWREEFKLWDAQLPNIQTVGKSNTALGKKISQEFRELKISHIPYALRHAWCIRLALKGVDSAIAAKWAGHSIEIHVRTYQQAISEAQHRQVFEQMKRREESD